MTDDALILIGRERARGVLEAHARRLRPTERVHVACYERDPGRELPAQLADVEAATVYVLPMFVAHNRDTTRPIPAALSALSGEVRYCEPVGRSPAVTDLLAARAADCVPPGPDVSVAVVAFGDSSLPYQRQTAEYHADRLRERTAFGEAVPCYLLQNPAVECVRYRLSGDRAVAVPLFVAPCEETERAVPEHLELDRGGVAYAAPLGEHEALTDAIRGELAKQRAVASSRAVSFEASLAAGARAVATDGRGR